MKLPRSKQKELREKGKSDLPQVPSGGALGRLREFEQQRGIADTDLSNPAASKAPKDKTKSTRKRKK